MEKTPFHYSPTVPGSIDAFRWDARGRTIEEVVLSNGEANGLRVAEMTVNVTQISAIAEDGSEHPFLSFKRKTRLKLNGIASGRSTRTRSMMSLATGRYETLRFYVNGDIDYMSDSRELRSIYGRDFIDFECEKAFDLIAGEPYEVTLRFNFLPFQSRSWQMFFKSWRTFQRPKAKWTT